MPRSACLEMASADAQLWAVAESGVSMSTWPPRALKWRLALLVSAPEALKRTWAVQLCPGASVPTLSGQAPEKAENVSAVGPISLT